MRNSYAVRRYWSWRLAVFYFWIVLVEGVCVAMASVSLAVLHSQRILITSLLIAASGLVVGAIFIGVFKLSRIPTFETDGATWLRIYGDGQERRVMSSEVESVYSTNRGMSVTTVGTRFEIPMHIRAYNELCQLVSSWAAANRSRPNESALHP